MSLLRELKILIREYGLRPNKDLGQVFLIDERILRRECDYAELDSKDVVLEIGTGTGFLTKLLAERCREVITIEKDHRLAEIAKRFLAEYDNVRLIVGDALEIDFPPFDKCVSNLPFYISTEITLKLLNYDFTLSILMYQKEVGRRLVAKPGSKDYSKLTVFVNALCRVELLEVVPRTRFYPIPDVDAALIKIVPLGRKLPIDRDFFLAMLDALFKNRNKKIKNSLAEFLRRFDCDPRRVLSRIDREILETRIFKLPVEEIIRLGELVYEEIGSIRDALR